MHHYQQEEPTQLDNSLELPTFSSIYFSNAERLHAHSDTHASKTVCTFGVDDKTAQSFSVGTSESKRLHPCF